MADLESINSDDPVEDDDLHSIDTEFEICVQFQNRSPWVCYLIWYDYEGKKVKYGTLKPRKSMRMNTFATHPWIAVDKILHHRMIIGSAGKLSYTAIKPDNMAAYIDNDYHDYTPIPIYLPVCSLQDICKRFVKNFYTQSYISQLNIPQLLINELLTDNPRVWDRVYNNE